MKKNCRITAVLLHFISPVFLPEATYLLCRTVPAALHEDSISACPEAFPMDREDHVHR